MPPVTSFAGSAQPIPASVQAEMRGVSWQEVPDCPGFERLRLLQISHWGFDGAVHQGELVAAAEVADELLWAFAQLFRGGFPIERMQRIDRYGGDDDASMAANNCSAFNFRVIAGTGVLSQHARGLAVDINPVQNPWCRGELISPPAGRAYLDRADVRPGMIVRPGPVTAIFDAIGWHWGGDWEQTKDYHHFARLPR
jgi:hypothetical protein